MGTLGIKGSLRTACSLILYSIFFYMRGPKGKVARPLKSKVWTVFFKVEVESKTAQPDGTEVTQKEPKVQCKLCRK